MPKSALIQEIFMGNNKIIIDDFLPSCVGHPESFSLKIAEHTQQLLPLQVLSLFVF
jgi:hypothetical protein